MRDFRKLTDSLQDSVVKRHLARKIALNDRHSDWLGWANVAVNLVLTTRLWWTTSLSIEINQNALLRDVECTPELD